MGGIGNMHQWVRVMDALGLEHEGERERKIKRWENKESIDVRRLTDSQMFRRR